MGYKTIIIDAQKCSGCRACENYCALRHENECNPAKSRIHVVKWEQDAIFVPISCMRCENAACEIVCPTNATYRNHLTGSIEVDQALCIGCLSCVSACPFGASFVAPDSKQILKCDLCGGDPTCAKVCPTGAITYEELTQEAYKKLVQNAEILPKLVQTAVGEG